MSNEIQALEEEIYKLNQKLAELRKNAPGVEGIPNYTFETLTGSVDLLSLFAGKDILFAIHNMGQACRYCTLWADGLNSFLPHLEDRFSVVLLSKDSPEVQQRLAHNRGWRFRMASHGGGIYIEEQNATPYAENMPGLVCYQRKGNSIVRKNATGFGPGDSFCSIWHVLTMAGIGEEGDDAFIPQYSYWKRPEAKAMEDGGQNLV